MNSVKKLLYRIKNILYLLFLVGSIRLLPSMFEYGFLGKLLLLSIIIYSLFMFYCYVKQEKELDHNIMANILGILLYTYVFTISERYLQSIGLQINELYFKINYFIIILGIVGIIATNSMLLSFKEEKQG